MSTAHALRDLALAGEHVVYSKLEQRLVDHYGEASKSLVRQAIEDERGRFAGARVHAFVPVPVERSVRARLG